MKKKCVYRSNRNKNNNFFPIHGLSNKGDYGEINQFRVSSTIKQSYII